MTPLKPPACKTEERGIAHTRTASTKSISSKSQAIANEVHRETALIDGEIIAVDNDEHSDDEDEPSCMSYEDNPQFSFNSSCDLIKFRALLQWEALLTSKQTTLDGYFSW